MFIVLEKWFKLEVYSAGCTICNFRSHHKYETTKPYVTEHFRLKIGTSVHVYKLCTFRCKYDI
jgi:hypothetical protein